VIITNSSENPYQAAAPRNIVAPHRLVNDTRSSTSREDICGERYACRRFRDCPDTAPPMTPSALYGEAPVTLERSIYPNIGGGLRFVIKPASLEYAQGIGDNRGVYLKLGHAW